MMANSTGIVLAATGISFANEWISADDINFRILFAGAGVALLFDGIERLNKTAGVGLSYMMLITVLLTKFNGKTPLETLAGPIQNAAGSSPKAQKTPVTPGGTGGPDKVV